MELSTRLDAALGGAFLPLGPLALAPQAIHSKIHAMYCVASPAIFYWATG